MFNAASLFCFGYLGAEFRLLSYWYAIRNTSGDRRRRCTNDPARAACCDRGESRQFLELPSARTHLL